MNFIRDNILKLLLLLFVAIVVIVIVVSCSNRTVTEDDAVGYAEIENRVQNAAIRYVNKNRSLLPKSTDKSSKIQIDTLIKNHYLKELKSIDDSNVKCNGYVQITKKSETEDRYRYTPHIKCGKYYETKTISDYIKATDDVVFSEDGLYQSNNMYYYRGENPRNFILLGEKLYRILEITDDNNLKLISTNRTSYSYVWDDRFNTEQQKYYGINYFEKSRMKDNLLFLYENTNEEAGEIYFSDVEKNYIVEHEFCVGKRSESDTSINSSSDCSETSNLYVGLLSLNDYYRVSISSECNSIKKHECNNYNYLFDLKRDGNIPDYATITAYKDDTYSFYSINEGDLELRRSNKSIRLYPVIYIDSNTLYKSGSGTYNDPYIVR